jgi:hypothetical protein
MSAHATHEDAKRSAHKGFLSGTERRRNPRVPLRWTLYLVCSGSRYPIRTITRDINQDGFYCLLNRPVRPGEQIQCDIVVPPHRSQDPDDKLYLRCRAQVVRVERLGIGAEFGLACRFDDYRVLRGISPRQQLQEKRPELFGAGGGIIPRSIDQESAGAPVDETERRGIVGYMLEK